MSPPIKPEPTGTATGAPADSPQDSLPSSPPPQKPATRLSNSEWLSAVGGRSDTPDFSGAESGASAAEPTPRQRHRRAVREWWNTLKNNFIKPVARATLAVPGLVAQKVTGVIADVEKPVLNAVGLDKLAQAQEDAAKSIPSRIQPGIDALIPKQKGSVVADLVEGITKFSEISLLTEGAGVTGRAKNVIDYAISVDPYEASLSEWVNKLSDKLSPGSAKRLIKSISQLTSVNPNDPVSTATLKRMGEGLYGEFAFALLGKFAKLVGLNKLLKAAPEAERPALQSQVEEATADLQASIKNGPDGPIKVVTLDDGTHTLSEPIPPAPKVEPLAADAPFTPGITMHADGSATIQGHRGVPNPNQHPLQPSTHTGETTLFVSVDPKESEAVARKFATNAGRVPEGSVTPIKAELKNPKVVGPTSGLNRDPVWDTMDQDDVIRQAAAEGHDGVILKEHHYGTDEVVLLNPQDATIPKADPNAPVFASRTDALVQASHANDTLLGAERAASRSSGSFTTEEMLANKEIADRIAQAKTPEDAQKLLEGTDFNFDSMGGDTRLRAQMEAVSEQLRAAFDQARHTGGVTVEDMFKKARELARQYGIEDIITRAEGNAALLDDLYAQVIVGDALNKQLSARLSTLYDVVGHSDDPALLDSALKQLNQWERNLRATSSINSSMGRGLRALQERQNPLGETIKLSDTTAPPSSAPISEPTSDVAAAASKEALRKQGDVRGFIDKDMSPEQIKAVLRLFKMANGDVRYAPDILKSMKIVEAEPQGWLEGATTFFVNSLISGIKTMQTILLSGAMIHQYEGLVHALTGIRTLNSGMAREGAARMYGAFHEAMDGLRAARIAFNTGASPLNPPSVIHARGGLTNRIITTPGRVAGALDEINKVTAYRANVRAASLRQGLEDGLSGPQMAARLDEDMRLAIDPASGVAQNNKLLQEAIIPTLSGDLGHDTMMGELSAWLSKYKQTRFVVPFIKPSVHTYRYVVKSTPFLNNVYSDIRATLAKGGEDAAKIHTRSAMTATIFGAGWLLAASDHITGRGPSNPALRREWLKTHQPYSFRIGNEWHSHRRLEPFSTYLGLAADAQSLAAETDDEDAGSQVLGAVWGSAFSNIINKTWMVGVSDFFDAVSSQDPNAVSKLGGGIAEGFIPQAVQQFNTDSVYRETRSLIDGLMAKTPGLSDNLPAAYGWDGTPHMKLQGMWNRNGSIFPSMAAAPALEDTLVDNGIVLSPAPTKDRASGIDYTDPSWSTDGSRPYDRWMELLAASGIRSRLEQATKESLWIKAPEGSPGSGAKKRAILLQSKLDAAQDIAFTKMIAEPRYRKLSAAWHKAKELSSKNIVGGRSAVDSLKNVIDSIRTSPPEAAKAIFAQ